MLLGFVLASPAASDGVQAQAVSPENDGEYRLIDAQRTRSRLTRTVNLGRVEDQLERAGQEGYALRWVAGFSSSMNLLLRKDSAGPREYRMVTSGRESAFLRDLNEAGAEGFRVVPNGIKAFEESSAFASLAWVAIMAREPERPRSTFSYSLVKGTDEGEAALAAAAADGRTLAAVVGRQGLVAADTLLFFEAVEAVAPAAPAPIGPREFRIIATARTSTTEADIRAAASEGLRVIGAGFGYMTFIMVREPDVEPVPVEYRLIAMKRRETALDELRATGAEGYEVAATSQNGQEAVFVLERRPQTTMPFDYDLLSLEEDSANEVLQGAEAAGYRVVTLLNDIVVVSRLGQR